MPRSEYKNIISSNQRRLYSYCIVIINLWCIDSKFSESHINKNWKERLIKWREDGCSLAEIPWGFLQVVIDFCIQWINNFLEGDIDNYF